jgi:hypothetical protein
MSKVLYAHRKETDGTIFYIGIGTEKRPYLKKSRNEYWHNTVNKYGYYVDILAKDLCIDDALELEEFIIDEIGRKDLGKGSLVNLNNGGKGNLQVSDITKKKMSKSATGRTAWNKGIPMSDEQKDKLSKAKIGVTSPRKGFKLSEETKEKIRNANIGKKITQETKDKISIANVGSKNSSAKTVYNIKTNEVFGTLKEAAQSIGVNYRTLSSMLNGKSKNKTNFEFKK